MISSRSAPAAVAGPAASCIRGHVLAVLPLAIEYIKAGKLRALAVTSPARFEALPDLPAMAEYLPAYEASVLTGLGVPTDTPVEIIEVINKQTNNALADPKIKAQLAALGNTVLPGSPVAFGQLIAEETEKWGKVIRAANIKAELPV